MRCTLLFVLRLMLDSDAPEALRGSITRVSDSESHSFADAEHLSALLFRMARQSAERKMGEERPVADDGAQ